MSASLEAPARLREDGPKVGDSAATAPSWVGAIALGAIIVSWAGFYLDIARHGDIGRDTFFAVGHLVIVAAIAAGAMAAWFALRLWTDSVRARIAAEPGMAMMMGGVLMTGVTLAIDNWWHAKFGVDVAVWSPPHLLLNLTFLVSALGVLTHFASRHWTGWRLAIMCGVFLAISSISLAEFEFGYPHYPLAWSAAALAAILGFGLLVAVTASTARWAATIAAGTAIGLRLMSLGLNAANGRSIAIPPIGILAGAVVLDIALRRGVLRDRPPWVRIVVAVEAMWIATFAVQSPWLRAFGKTWWPNDTLPTAFVLGAVAALAGAGAGRFVGLRLRAMATPGDESTFMEPRRKPFTLRSAGIPLAGLALSFGIAATAAPFFRSPSGYSLGSYAFDHGAMRVVIPGATRDDWISIIGPVRTGGLFGPAAKSSPRPEPNPVAPTGVIGGSIQGTLRPILGDLVGRINVSWLGALTWHDGAFVGKPRGHGEWVMVWYLKGDRVWSGFTLRGTKAPLVLRNQTTQPATPPGAFFKFAGTALVAALVIAAVVIVGRILAFAAGSASPRRFSH